MAYIYALVAGHLELVLYAFSLSAGVLAQPFLALLRRRGFGGGGFGGFRRRRRPGGLLGGLALFFLLGPILVIGLIAFFLYSVFSQFQRRR